MTATILETKKVPIDSVKPYPDNARVGDVDSIRQSLRKNGFYRPVVVREQTSEILAGNHTWKAAKAEEYTEIEATFIQCDAETAKRINLVDNRAPELGGYDEQALVALLGSLPELEGTGWTGADYEELVAKVGGPLGASDGPGEGDGDDYERPGVLVLCTDSRQQRAAYERIQLMLGMESGFDGVEARTVAV